MIRPTRPETSSSGVRSSKARGRGGTRPAGYAAPRRRQPGGSARHRPVLGPGRATAVPSDPEREVGMGQRGRGRRPMSQQEDIGPPRSRRRWSGTPPPAHEAAAEPPASDPLREVDHRHWITVISVVRRLALPQAIDAADQSHSGLLVVEATVRLGEVGQHPARRTAELVHLPLDLGPGEDPALRTARFARDRRPSRSRVSARRTRLFLGRCPRTAPEDRSESRRPSPRRSRPERDHHERRGDCSPETRNATQALRDRSSTRRAGTLSAPVLLC